MAEGATEPTDCCAATAAEEEEVTTSQQQPSFSVNWLRLQVKVRPK